jgi:hypothetical protein
MKFSYLKYLTIKTRMHLIVAIAFIIIVGLVALLIFINIDKKNTNLKPEQLTFSLIKDKIFLNSIKLKPQKEKEIILIEASKILRDEIHSVTDNKHKDFVLDDFKNVFPIIDFMLAIDSKNGHAIYFMGEVYRLLNDYDQFLEYFQMYLAIEDSIGSHLQKVTNARLCYETAYGYCEQRTAWISQLLANYYFKKGISESDLHKKLESLNIAMKQIQNVRNHFPTGFNSSSVTMSTLELETKLKADISK